MNRPDKAGIPNAALPIVDRLRRRIVPVDLHTSLDEAADTIEELHEALEHDIRFFDSIANDERWEGTGIANLCNGYATRRRELLARARGDQ